jgi:hypothetical protein
MGLAKMNNYRNRQLVWIVIILIVSLGGYILAFFQFRTNASLADRLLSDDMNRIGVIDDELSAIRTDTAITMEELKKSQNKINKLIEEALKRDTTSLNLDDALKIINEL